MPELRQPPYPTVLKPYGQSLVALAKEREDIVCLTGDLTRRGGRWTRSSTRSPSRG